ncbi:MAG: hypothetical protein U9N49_02500 [Campylobacterota bacterium]|nr:hypothetical protein [Campylobacterota bacterium]
MSDVKKYFDESNKNNHEHNGLHHDGFDYHYIYYYDANHNTINRFDIQMTEEIENQECRIKLIPSQSFQKNGVEIYEGKLFIRDYFYIYAKNSFEVMTFYFKPYHGIRSSSDIHGIGLGLSYHHKQPLSTTCLLLKDKIEDEQRAKRLDLYLNETEYILTKEQSEATYNQTKENFVLDIDHKLNNLATFVRKARDVLEDELMQDPYLLIFHKSIISTNEISKKVTNDQYYYIYRRRSTIKTFLRSIALREKRECYMIYPTAKNDAKLFDEHEPKSQKVLEVMKQLSIEGLSVHMILAVDYDFNITPYFSKQIKSFIKHNIDLKLCFVEDIRKGSNISSYDFLYPKEQDVAIYTNRSDRIRMFKVTKSASKIEELVNDYNSIEKLSHNYDAFVLKKANIKTDNYLEQLQGDWYCYFYWVMNKQKDGYSVWHDKLTIDAEENAVYRFETDEIMFTGKVNTTFNEKQAFIYLNNIHSKDLSLISINKSDIYSGFFKVSLLDKQIRTDNDMASFGLFSRKKVDKSLVKDILGDGREVSFIESDAFAQRITEVYYDMKFSSGDGEFKNK